MPLVNTTPYPGFSTPVSYAAIVLADNPWGYWKLDEPDKSDNEIAFNEIGGGDNDKYQDSTITETKIVLVIGI